MAAYPDGNPGAYPLDPGTPTGQFRILYGDTESEPYDPPVPEVQNYGELSDSEIEGFLAQGDGSIPRGVGFYYLLLAGRAALVSKSAKDYDLAVDTTKRADGLIAIANMWFGKADAEEADYFDVVPVGSRGRRCKPELAPRPVRWC